MNLAGHVVFPGSVKLMVDDYIKPLDFVLRLRALGFPRGVVLVCASRRGEGGSPAKYCAASMSDREEFLKVNEVMEHNE